MLLRPRDGRSYWTCQFCTVVSTDLPGEPGSAEERDRHEHDAHAEWFALAARFRAQQRAFATMHDEIRSNREIVDERCAASARDVAAIDERLRRQYP